MDGHYTEIFTREEDRMSFSPSPLPQTRVKRSIERRLVPLHQGVSSPGAVDETVEARGLGRSSRRFVRLFELIGAKSERLLNWGVFLGFLTLLLLAAPGLDVFLASSDHGHQLTLGTEILHGKVPGVDVITAYGPGAMYTSALGLWASDSLVGETLVCASGYALALFLIYRLVRDHGSRLTALAAAAAGFVLLSRFYKWYVWLIPLLTLWALCRYLSSPVERRSRWISACGLILGLSWLYRPDMASSELLVSLIVIGLAETVSPHRRVAQVVSRLGLLLVGFSVLPFLWLGYLFFGVGSRAPLVFFETTIGAALAVAKGLAHPIPANVDALRAFYLAPVVLIVAALAGLNRELIGRGDRRSRFLLVAAAVGLGTIHQAMHRRDPAHLLQVLAPLVVCAFLTYAEFRRRLAEAPFRRLRTWAFCLVGISYFALLAIGANGLRKWGHEDLVSPSFQIGGRYRDLAHPLSAADRYPAVKLIHVIREQTEPRDPILIFPLDCQFYALAQRRPSGRLHAYYADLFDDPQSQAENLAAIRKDMPALVVLPSDRRKIDPENGMEVLEQRSREAHRAIEDFLRAHYTRVAFDDGKYVVLGRESQTLATGHTRTASNDVPQKMSSRRGL